MIERLLKLAGDIPKLAVPASKIKTLCNALTLTKRELSSAIGVRDLAIAEAVDAEMNCLELYRKHKALLARNSRRRLSSLKCAVAGKRRRRSATSSGPHSRRKAEPMHADSGCERPSSCELPSSP